MPTRFDFLHDVADSQNERRLQQEALSMLRANKSAQAILDREAAAKDARERWAAEQVHASRPVPQAGLQQAAQQRMMARVSPGWAPPAPLTPQASPVFTPGGSAAAARDLMQRRQGGR
ncbi:hypothetical protein QWZ14_30180 [Paeniroseomonas aquatica]|uniref:Uncharacterized protein n=1 Tax=Paeniroseomonas aquatica TaxID=373043 RepID=A0ABT8AH25_9PROT|nr:hypothetical protein [Paeniroseomonas aquatica]MDN3568664.1 hypothetical protein [Paeniroseomonas aquatica]